MLSKLFTLGAVIVQGTQINQVEASSPSPGLETLFYQSDGQADPTFAAVMSQSPVLSFTTSAIVRALGVSAMGCLSITTGLDAYFQKYQPGGTRLTGSNSLKVTFSNGILCPRRIEADSRGRATITYDMAAISPDGVTSPITVTQNQAMPSLLAADQMFTVGPAVINGTALEGVRRTVFDTGIRLVVVQADGEAYPTFAAVNDRRPTITIRSTMLDFPAQGGLGFVVGQSATDSLVYFRKIAKGGVRVPNATAEHVKLSVDDGLITVREVSAEHGGEGGSEGGEIEVMIEPAFDGTNDIVAINTASAIA